MIAAHVAAALFAVLVGGVVVLGRKGTRVHRVLGWVYVAAMAVMIGTSFGVRSVTDSVSVFHLISVVTGLVVAAGVAVPLLARRRVRRWLEWHLRLMLTSYVMLVMTGVGQFFDDLPLPHPVLNAIVFLQAPAVVGFVLIHRTAQRWGPRPGAGRALPDPAG